MLTNAEKQCKDHFTILCRYLPTLPFPELRDAILSNHSPAERLQLIPSPDPIHNVGHPLIHKLTEPWQLNGCQGVTRKALCWLLAKNGRRMEGLELYFQESHRHIPGDAHINTRFPGRHIVFSLNIFKILNTLKPCNRVPFEVAIICLYPTISIKLLHMKQMLTIKSGTCP